MSNYNGTLITLGTGLSAYSIPTSIIAADTYKVCVIMQDFEPWTDGNGYLHRNNVSLSESDGYKALKIEFDTIPLYDSQLSNILNNIYSQFTDEQARECDVTAYIPEYDRGSSGQGYITQKCYMADINPLMYYAGNENDARILYRPIHFTFVGGVAR